ncbi:MAG: HAD-IIIA family hydrolase, partial [Deltaproteobacteria bacterium]|nr:HAD-IIIA family hydrolase [Deltaproteobacteria bacterium]
MSEGCVVLLDRDGTLIEDRHYLHDPAGVVLLPGVGEGLKALAEAGCRLGVLTNQSGIGRGYYAEADGPVVLVANDDITAAIHGLSADIVTLYGRDMWDGRLTKNRYGTYPEEY